VLDLAVRRFSAFARLQGELAEAQGKLAEREAVENAKRILMQSKGLSEPGAYAELRRKAIDEGMITLRASGLRKVKDGVTTIEEVVRETVK